MDAQQAHIFSLRLAVAIWALLCCGLWYGWQAAPSELTIHVPPDLRSRSTRKWWDVPPENIYAFALYIFGQLNRWPTDGEVDYHRAIFALQPYLTPACKTFLKSEWGISNSGLKSGLKLSGYCRFSVVSAGTKKGP